MSRNVARCLSALALYLPFFAYAGPYTYNAAGDEVTDTMTGLIWRRCSEGQSWDSVADTCTGAPANYTYKQALARAQLQSTSAMVWRLPNLKELTSLVDRTQRPLAISQTAFPAIGGPKHYVPLYWTSTTDQAGSNNAWVVDFVHGSLNRLDRSLIMYVRFVR